MSAQLSEAALSAKAIKAELKANFPKIKFSVSSSRYSGGNSVYVEWENGPTSENVDNIVKKYQYGKFDGMTDSYEYTNSRKDIPQVMFVQVRRAIDQETKLKVFDYLRKYYDYMKDMQDMDHYVKDKMRRWVNGHQEVHRFLWNKDLTNGFNI